MSVATSAAPEWDVNLTLVYKKKTFFELFQICEMIWNVSRLLKSKSNSISLHHIKIFATLEFLFKNGKNAIQML